ncbi:hypothetical protein ACFL35_11350, partial [Candidatus Riflebacteria bacterium]
GRGIFYFQRADMHLRLLLIFFVTTFMLISLGCGDGVHPIGDDLLPRNLLPDSTSNSEGEQSRSESLPAENTSNLLQNERDNSTANTNASGSTNIFENGTLLNSNPAQPSSSANTFSPQFFSYQKVSNENDSVSLNGNVADKILSDKIHDGLNLSLYSFAPSLLKVVGPFNQDGVQSSDAGITTTNTTTEQPAAVASSSSGTNPGTPTSTGTTTGDIPQITLPALYIAAKLFPSIASSTPESSASSSHEIEEAQVFANDVKVSFFNDQLIIDDDKGRELKFYKATKVGSETQTHYLCEGKISAGWDLLTGNPAGLQVHGMKTDVYLNASDTISRIKVGFQNSLSVIGLHGLYDFSMEVQGLGGFYDSSDSVMQVTFAPEITANVGETSGNMQLRLQGVSGVIQQEKEYVKSSLAFAKKVYFEVTNGFVPDLLFRAIDKKQQDYGLFNSHLKFTFNNLSFNNTSEILDGFLFHSFEIEGQLRLKQDSNLFSKEPIRLISFKTLEPLQLINNSIEHPLAGQLELEIEYSDGKSNSFNLRPENGKYSFDGRLRSPDGGEFQIQSKSTETILNGEVGYANGTQLKTEIKFPTTHSGITLSAKTGYYSLLQEKEMEIEFSLNENDEIQGYWTQFKPILRQGEFVSNKDGSILVRDNNRIELASFK